MYVKCNLTDFEVAKEGWILNLASGYRRFEFAFIVYDEISDLADKELEISIRDLNRDIGRIINRGEVLNNLSIQSTLSY